MLLKTLNVNLTNPPLSKNDDGNGDFNEMSADTDSWDESSDEDSKANDN